MRGAHASQLALALGVVALGVFFIVDAQYINAGPAYSRVGPDLIPTIVGGATTAIGVLLAVVALRGGWPTGHEAGEARRIGWTGLGLISAGLVVQILLLERAGFVLSSALLFLLVAAGFHSRRHLRDAAIGLALSLVVYVGFTRGLDLALPAGLLEGLL